MHDRYIDIYGRHPLLRMRGATRKRSRPNREYGFSPAESAFSACIGSDRDRISPAESAFLISWDNAMIWDFKREGDALFRNLQVS